MNVNVAILRTDGTNCDQETYFAFKLAGGSPEMVHVNDLFNKRQILQKFQILVLPGGFSYGDDILSGKILAIELLYRFNEEIKSFIKDGKLILGICNGFQMLVRMGLLPGGGGAAEKATLIFNDSAHFECRWIRLRIEESPSIFTYGLEGRFIELPVAHGEGKFVARNQKILDSIENQKLVSFRFAHADGGVATDYPANPNGSIHAIAGISNASGTILGLMPHPERYVKFTQHPNWTRQRPWMKKGDGLMIFQNAIDYARKNL